MKPFSKSNDFFVVDTLILLKIIKIIKLSNFCGKLTDVSIKKASLLRTHCSLAAICRLYLLMMQISVFVFKIISIVFWILSYSFFQDNDSK